MSPPTCLIRHAIRREFGGMGGEPLKRAPKGWPSDHPHLELLKMKQFFAGLDIPMAHAMKHDFAKIVARKYSQLVPLVRWLQATTSGRLSRLVVRLHVRFLLPVLLLSSIAYGAGQRDDCGNANRKVAPARWSRQHLAQMYRDRQAALSAPPEPITSLELKTPERERPDIRIVELWFDLGSDGDVRQARRKLLEENDVLLFEKGGQGYTVLLKSKKDGSTVRLKASLPHPTNGKYLADAFVFERDLAIKASEAGVGPKAVWDPQLQMLRMENIDGENFKRFQGGELANMSEAARETWLGNFLPALAGQVHGLHKAGIAHLDLKPANLMIPKNNEQGKKVVVLDFGISLTKEMLEAKHRELNGLPYNGSPNYQGLRALEGKPGFADDYTSLRHLFVESVPPPVSAIKDRPFFQARPNLRALLALWGEPSGAPDAVVNYSRAVELALVKEPSQKQQEEFDTFFKNALAERSPGQRLRILFSDPQFHDAAKLAARYAKPELKKLVEEGMRENGWEFVDGPSPVKRNPPERALPVWLWSRNELEAPIDFSALRESYRTTEVRH